MLGISNHLLKQNLVLLAVSSVILYTSRPYYGQESFKIYRAYKKVIFKAYFYSYISLFLIEQGTRGNCQDVSFDIVNTGNASASL